jgi:hypothetical protein
LKKPSVAFSTPPTEKCDFPLAHIFNGLQPSKMAAHPCTARSRLKNSIFQQAASQNWKMGARMLRRSGRMQSLAAQRHFVAASSR